MLSGVIPDGTYDAFVVDAESGLADDGTEHMHLDLTILSGEQKGNVVSLTAAGLPGTEIDLMGMPATLTVIDGMPTVRIDD
jgi:hypothetical protein